MVKPQPKNKRAFIGVLYFSCILDSALGNIPERAALYITLEKPEIHEWIEQNVIRIVKKAIIYPEVFQNDNEISELKKVNECVSL